MERVWIGTSGWSYDHWRDAFYPEDTPHAEWLDYYAGRLASVEINASFYRLPAKKTLHDWAKRVPADFLFAFKASRYLTHMKKLKPAAQSRKRMLERARELGKHLGPILFQLPPHWRANPERLDRFLGELPRRYRYAFEFRDESWWSDEIFEALERHGAAFVWSDIARRRAPLADTAEFHYVRWHGPGEDAYTGRYGRNRLRPLARKVREWNEDG
ncbi:MAG: DUF72 domain-containing protein, partial [Gammaproteobacteria bacterium]